MTVPLSLALVLDSGNRSQWPHVLKLSSAAICLLGLRVRIPPAHGSLSLVSVVFCKEEVCASGWSLVQRSLTECAVCCMLPGRGFWEEPISLPEETYRMCCECDRKASIMRGPWPNNAVSPRKRKIYLGIPADLTLVWYSATWIRSRWCIVVTSGANASHLFWHQHQPLVRVQYLMACNFVGKTATGYCCANGDEQWGISYCITATNDVRRTWRSGSVFI